MDRRERRRLEQRRRIETAAVELLAEHRFDEISVQSIADRADVAASTFYAHFDGKQQLLDDLRLETTTLLAAGLSADAQPSDDPLVNFEATLSTILQQLDTNPSWSKFALDLRGEIDEFGGPVDEALDRMIGRCVDRGLLPEPDDRNGAAVMFRETIRAALRRSLDVEIDPTLVKLTLLDALGVEARPHVSL